MKRRFAEHTIIFFSVLKWVVLATMTGAVVGLATTGFLAALRWSTEFSHQYAYYFLALPVAMFLSIIMVKYLAPEAEGHGTEKVIEAVHKNAGRIKLAVVPIKLVATVITIASGGSVGKEGPCAQIGAALSSMLADIFRFNDHDRKKLVICGISAGFAAVFGTPIAGSIFGVEVLFAGSILYDVLLPSFIAGITSYHVASFFGIHYFYHPIDFVPIFSESFFAKVLLAGLVFGLCSAILIEMLKVGEKLSSRIKWWAPYKGLLGGVLLVGLAMLISKDYLGLGLSTIESTLEGAHAPWYSFITKTVFSSITLSFGGSGGIVTPIFFIGATAGSVFGQLMNLDPATFAAIGMVSLLAGAANTPIAASIMAVELFGPSIAPYATIACVISFLMTGHRSVYPSQILSVRKTPSVQVEIGKEFEDLSVTFRPEKERLLDTPVTFGNKVKEVLTEIGMLLREK